MKKITLGLLLFGILTACTSPGRKTALPYGEKVLLSKETLRDKIKGGWAGQTIGCTYGGPTEFKYRGAMIPDQQPLIWYDDYARETFKLDPGLYDDVYMDLTFVEVIERCGLEAPADSFALAFAHADYKLWHANQAARYNILQGIMPPASGHWLNNPHADDIDFQIEADFAGMMCPGMIQTGTQICDKIGHIMNSGDGWYGGVYMSAMYSLAFVTDDIPFIVEEALKTIPAESKFRKCIEEVLVLYRQYPGDWKKCWYELEQKHAFEVGCPEGVFNVFNIDATINAAYVVMGLLYGEGDFYKTMEISTRCGQDSDCNPASAAGILGVIMGYNQIPDYWKPGIEQVEKLDFPYTHISLERIYDLNYEQAYELILKHGGEDRGEQLAVKLQQPVEVAWEQNFGGHYPVERRMIKKEVRGREVIDVEFTGNGVVLMGAVIKYYPEAAPDYVAHLVAKIDGEVVEEIRMPLDYIKRKYDIFYRYQLPDQKHRLSIEWLNPDPRYALQLKDLVVYGSQPVKTVKPY